MCVMSQVRDIQSRPEWQEEFAMTVPVLAVQLGPGACALADGLCFHNSLFYAVAGEVQLPRSPPRISAERLLQHLEEALHALSPS